MVMSGMLLTTLRATRDADDLLVHIPVGWNVVAGTGAHTNALDINHGWTPSSIRGTLQLIRQDIKDIWEGAQRDVSHLPGVTTGRRRLCPVRLHLGGLSGPRVG
jgi:hypothetical protein